MTKLLVKLVFAISRDSEFVEYNGEWEISTVTLGPIVAESWFDTTTCAHHYSLRIK